MKRCISRFTRLPSPRTVPFVQAAVMASFMLVAAASLLAPSPSAAQTTDATLAVRQFPKTAMRGEMVMQNHPELTLNGKAERLSPGARIFDQNNHLILSGQLVGSTIAVNYVRDTSGQIQQVWLLNAEEAREKRAGTLATIFNFITGNTPSTDAPAAP